MRTRADHDVFQGFASRLCGGGRVRNKERGDHTWCASIATPQSADDCCWAHTPQQHRWQGGTRQVSDPYTRRAACVGVDVGKFGHRGRPGRGLLAPGGKCGNDSDDDQNGERARPTRSSTAPSEPGPRPTRSTSARPHPRPLPPRARSMFAVALAAIRQSGWRSTHQSA